MVKKAAASNNKGGSKKSNGGGNKRSLRIGFLHPDLGIGGAERLVVDAALGLQEKGHTVKIYTAHHDPNHCFRETKNGQLSVSVHGDFFPLHIFHKFHIIFTILRNLWCAIQMLRNEHFDVIFVDQLSISIPLLKLSGAKILFYCHFPDKLLAKRESLLKKLYRVPIDWLEEYTTGKADVIVVNSKFTASQFERVFPRIAKKVTPDVLYPSLNIKNYDEKPVGEVDLGDVPNNKQLILSINRFERKKNIRLAVEAFAELQKLVDAGVWKNLHLVLAGGYDPRVTENVEHVKELQERVDQLGLTKKVSFLRSFSEAQRRVLLDRSLCLLYTPSFEHFGIGPLEGMYASVPVIAINNGGPLETVDDGVTGFLREADPVLWAKAIQILVNDPVKAKEMGKTGRKWVANRFSLQTFSDQLDNIVCGMV